MVVLSVIQLLGNKNCLSGTAYCVPNVLTATSQRLPPKAQRPPPLAPSSAPNWFTTASVQPSSGRSCENDDPLMISCPDGMIISRITNAFYGEQHKYVSLLIFRFIN